MTSFGGKAVGKVWQIKMYILNLVKCLIDLGNLFWCQGIKKKRVNQLVINSITK